MKNQIIVICLAVLFSCAGLNAQNTYKITIDNCHDGIRNEGTGNTLTAEFLSGSKVVGRVSKSKFKDCANPSFEYKTSSRITAVRISTDGSDAFYIDKAVLYFNSKKVFRYGNENGNGWCLSTDANDANTGGWKGKCAGTKNACVKSFTFKYKNIPTLYKIAIDNCHDGIRNEGTGNTITAEFLSGSKVVGRVSKSKFKDCANPSFEYSSTSKVTAIRLTISGGDAFYIDKAVLYRDGKQAFRYGNENGNGWCLSTDANDSKTGGWNDKCAATGNACVKSFTFKYKR